MSHAVIQPSLPPSWANPLAEAIRASSFQSLMQFVARERDLHVVFPPEDHVFRALELTPLSNVRVVVLGQDPYHGDGQAHGLSFSVPPGIKIPPSLRNIFKELNDDIGIPPASHGCLESWARQGVLLLNAVLTVRAHQANSHRNKGWESFTDAVLRTVDEEPRSLVFVLWGAHAQKKKTLIDASRHLVLEAPHPSPLSAHQGFLGSRPFSRINEHLSQHGSEVIRWALPDN